MKRLLAAALFVPLTALAAGLADSPYSGLIIEVQEKLHELGFDAGPADGDFNEKTQAALAQFQLSRVIPASGQLDDLTLQELGVARATESAAAGTSLAPNRE